MERIPEKDESEKGELRNVMEYLTRMYGTGVHEILKETDPLLHYDIAFE
jgi:hypothetical protein